MRLEHLSKTDPGNPTPAVDDLSMDVFDGEIITLLGPSGCGKSTTLRMVAGLEMPDSGSIYFGEKPVVISEEGFRLPPDKRELGMVFQSYAIWPHMTVEENVAFPLKSKKMQKAEISDRVEKILDLVGLPGMQKRRGRCSAVGSNNVLPWLAPSLPNPEPCCLMSHSATSTPSYASRYGSRSSSSRGDSTSPFCSSRTTR